MKFVMAIVYMCIGSNCEQHNVMIDQTFCRQNIPIKVPMNGEWQSGRVKIECKK